ncbi:hypothetical protein D3C71_1758640 [compost metagenome]
MISNQDHFDFMMTIAEFFKMIDNLETGFILVISFDHLVIHRWGARDIHGQMIGMGGAKNWNIHLCLRPGSGIGRMSVYNAVDAIPMLVKNSMGLGI